MLEGFPFAKIHCTGERPHEVRSVPPLEFRFACGLAGRPVEREFFLKAFVAFASEHEEHLGSRSMTRYQSSNSPHERSAHVHVSHT